mmetsp:Transcript_5276/g.10158  ORF Transcript_5276/g.10158 Transcript_5276/m.10158 type:complete len:269 (-) Transcript_5276:951-1757(-)
MYRPVWYTGVFNLAANKTLDINAEDAQICEEINITPSFEGHQNPLVVQKNLDVRMEFYIQLSWVDFALIGSKPLEQAFKALGVGRRISERLEINGRPTLQLANFHDTPSEVVLESKEIDTVFIEIQLQAAFFGPRWDGGTVVVTRLSRIECQFSIEQDFRVKVYEKASLAHAESNKLIPRHRKILDFLPKQTFLINRDKPFRRKESDITMALKSHFNHLGSLQNGRIRVQDVVHSDAIHRTLVEPQPGEKTKDTTLRVLVALIALDTR